MSGIVSGRVARLSRLHAAKNGASFEGIRSYRRSARSTFGFERAIGSQRLIRPLVQPSCREACLLVALELASLENWLDVLENRQRGTCIVPPRSEIRLEESRLDAGRHGSVSAARTGEAVMSAFEVVEPERNRPVRDNGGEAAEPERWGSPAHRSAQLQKATISATLCAL